MKILFNTFSDIPPEIIEQIEGCAFKKGDDRKFLGVHRNSLERSPMKDTVEFKGNKEPKPEDKKNTNCLGIHNFNKIFNKVKKGDI